MSKREDECFTLTDTCFDFSNKGMDGEQCEIGCGPRDAGGVMWTIGGRIGPLVDDYWWSDLSMSEEAARILRDHLTKLLGEDVWRRHIRRLEDHRH